MARDEYSLTNKTVLRELTRLYADYPRAERHREAIRVLRSDFTFARRYQDGTWAVTMRFGPDIAAMFGITRDVMIIYTQATDLQPRTVASFPKRVRDLATHRMCEDHLVFVSTRDPFGRAKLERWSQENPFVALPLPDQGDAPRLAQQLLVEMKRSLASRNLYDETLPVTGRDFFGRRRILTQLQEEIRQGNVCGVFGLRKTGKTSLIKELGARFATSESSRIFVFRDLETLPMDSPRLGIEFVQDLRDSFLKEFRRRNVRTAELTDLSGQASVGQLRRALQASLADCSKRGIQVVLALDEIEYLVGDSKMLEAASRPEVPEILGAIRSLVQENSNFNVLMSGITSAVTHRGALYGVENPLFSWAKTYYLQPMLRPEISSLTTEVGNRMGIRWDEAALTSLFAHSGGQVFLHRTLAAAVVAQVDSERVQPRLTSDEVDGAVQTWKTNTSERLRQMFESFWRHYPVEADLLQTLIDGDMDISEVQNAFPDETRRLIELDLLVEGSDRISLGTVSRRLRDDRVVGIA
ncbi:AAA family ATPase [Nocardioides guangzhouensis]|uniref:AAA family ATPase n=1 Tax=Nocardioides guangzhouensis TaxID=2497878 RepID=UPI00143828F7|nr:ATP-binding protein [Nocardioides guangzhouensis]